MRHSNQASNLKQALRKKSAYMQTQGCYGDVVTVWERGIISTNPLKAGLVKSQEYALPLINNLVFLVVSARIGVPYEGGEGYVALEAVDFAESLVGSINNPVEASAVLLPYFNAVRGLNPTS
jgi:hypothetical protein